MPPKEIELSIIIPVYNSADIFPELCSRLFQSLNDVVGAYEIIAVIDGCVDNSYQVASEIAENFPSVKIIEFSRNFGHQAAISAGLLHCRGAMAMVMDDDLEDPPEVIPEFIARMREGYDVVYGVRKKRKVSILRKTAFYLFYRLLNRVTDIQLPADAGDFCLMKRKVVDVLNAMPEKNRYIRGLRTWVGFRQTGLEYERGHRYKGESQYNIFGYLKLAVDGILSFSYNPLKFVSATGFIIAFISFVLGLRLIVLKLLDKTPDVPGWASILVSVLFLGGIQMISIGIVGQYIARVYDEAKQRPQFIVNRMVGMIPEEEVRDEQDD